MLLALTVLTFFIFQISFLNVSLLYFLLFYFLLFLVTCYFLLFLVTLFLITLTLIAHVSPFDDKYTRRFNRTLPLFSSLSLSFVRMDELLKGVYGDCETPSTATQGSTWAIRKGKEAKAFRLRRALNGSTA